MSRFRDIADAASSGLGELLGRIQGGHEELAHVDADELAEEIEARRAAGDRSPKDNPVARRASASEKARDYRRRKAEEREARVRAAREQREKVEREKAERAFREAQEKASQQAEAEYQRFREQARKGGPIPPPGSAGSAGSGNRSPFGGIGQDRELAKHYKTLNLPYGAEWSEVKAAYRKLMRKYHPDMHNQSAKKQKVATELSVQVTQAYKALEKARGR